MIKVGTFCSGIGSPEQGIKELEIEHINVFACEKDKYARQSYLSNHSTLQMCEDMTTCDMSLPEMYSDLCIAGIPCQAFSLAGKRLGELDPRGLLFYNFYDYVKRQQPKYFIIENVKGLLSSNGGKVFSTWLELLGRSVNNQNNLSNHEDSLMYDLHWTVLNSKYFGVPQNRERVFIVGIRNDIKNDFKFPVGFPLTVRLKDILEPIVDEKYYLSDKMVKTLIRHQNKITTEKQPDVSGTIHAGYFKMGSLDQQYVGLDPDEATTLSGSDGITDIRTGGNGSMDLKHSWDIIIEGKDKVNKIGYINQDTQASAENTADAIYPTLSVGTHGYSQGYIEVKEATQLGFSIAEEGDSINLSNPDSSTPGGRVGKGIANTLDTACNQAVVEPVCVAMRGRNPKNPSDRTVGNDTEQRLEPNSQGITNTITSVAKDNLILSNEPKLEIIGNAGKGHGSDDIYNESGIACCQTSQTGGLGGTTGLYKTKNRIRKLTPLECFRLQAFPDDFFYKCKYASQEQFKELLTKFPKLKWKKCTLNNEAMVEIMSDSQLYKQAGNSITVWVMKAIIKNLIC